MSEEHKNKDWLLRLTVDWKLKEGRDLKVFCIHCKGKGTWTTKGGMFSYPDEIVSHTCSKCNGRGSWAAPDIDPKPKVPSELFDRLKLTFFQYWNEMEGQNPTLARLNAEAEIFEEEEKNK